MDNYKLMPLTDSERKFATENHNLVYGFLHHYGYSLEIYYDVAIFGYLKAVQIYNRREDLQSRYSFSFISRQYMRAEIGNYFRMENAKKRKPSGMLVSLDSDYLEVASGNSPEVEVLEAERLTDFWDNLSDTQRKITEMKIDGYSGKEIYSVMEIKSSTYYREVQRIKKVLAETIS